MLLNYLKFDKEDKSTDPPNYKLKDKSSNLKPNNHS